MVHPISIDFKDIQEKLSFQLRPWERSFQFWLRAANIYTGYKAFQLRVSFVKDRQRQEEMWEKQHELAAHKIYDLCSQLGGFFLKVAQIIGKPDLAPAAWVKRLVTLCDQAPTTPYDAVQLVLRKELGQSVEDVFERFDPNPLGSASIAQVHRARLRGDNYDVVVKVQHPGVQDLMMTDIRNLQALALYIQKMDLKFDLFSIAKEMEKQIGYEFDFKREAGAMERIRQFLYQNNKKSPVTVPRVMQDIVTRRVLVMEYIDGIPILNLGDEIAKRGINPDGMVAAAAKQNILNSLTLAYGQMILKSGFFHADPHPGNILICKDSEVALLDYGQVKDLPEKLRLGYAGLVLAIADSDPVRASESYRELGIETLSMREGEQKEMLKLAQEMFDTKLPPGVAMLQPFSDDSPIKKTAVQAFPEELFSVLRTVHLLRGLSVGLGINYSCAEQWRPIAEEVLYRAASNNDGLLGSTRGTFDNGLLDLLEGKLTVLRFQIKLKDQLYALATRFETPSTSDSVPDSGLTADANYANAAREKARELSLDLKSITQLYNEYAVPFELWEICLEMLYFANYSGDADSSIIRETWARLIDQALSRGGIAEACSVLKRIGSHIYPGDGAILPLDTLCLHLEKAALERLNSGTEVVGDEDIARALLAACKGSTEPVLNTYDQLLSNGAILPSPNLRLRLLRSVLVVLREWAMSIFAQRMGTSATGASLILGGTFSLEQTAILNQGVRDKITSAANRYMTELRRLAIPQSQTEAVYRGFRELEESLMSPFSFDRF